MPEYLESRGIAEPMKKFKCLVHNDSNPSMNVRPDGLMVHCFSCNASFDVFSLAAKLEGMPSEGPEFLTKCVYVLADRFNIKYSIVNSNSERAALRQAYFRAYRIVSDYLQDTAIADPTDEFKKELTKRKWSSKTKQVIEYGLGCTHSFKDVYNVLLKNEFSKEFLDMIGLIRPDIFNRDSVIFTIYDEFRKPIAFYSRDTKYEEKKVLYDNRDKMELRKTYQPMKYNSTANFSGIYEKNLHLYGIHDAKDFHKVILVEGHGCKMSLKLNGVDNVVALGGFALTDATLQKFISLGVTSIVLTLDNDIAGKERLKNIIRQHYGKTSLDMLVIDMANGQKDVKDPDEFIRKIGIEKFKEISEKNALEWLAITELTEKGDSYVVLHDIVPLIAQEKSPLNRLRIINTISDMTGIDKNTISEEVDQKIAVSKDRKSEFALKVMDEARELVAMNPNALEAAMNLISTKLNTLNGNGSNNEDLFGSNETLKSLVKQEEQQESGEVIPIIKTGFVEFDEHIPLPTNEAFILVPAPPNAMKTSWLLTLGKNILDFNNDTIVIMHTTDDSRGIYFDRLVANEAGLHINWIKNPTYFLNEELKLKRKAAYRKISNWIRDERLIIKDVVHGNTVEYEGGLIKYYRDKFPTKKIVFFCDNFHKIGTEAGYEDKRLKTEYVSQIMKGYTNKYDCVIFATVELGKMGMHDKPQNASAIKETAALEYDANLILYLWNSLNSRRDEEPLVFNSTVMTYNKDIESYLHKNVKKPIIEILVLKNKLSEFKESMFFCAHPELATLINVTKEELVDVLSKPAGGETDVSV